MSKERAANQTTITFSLDKELQAMVKARCKQLRISRSAYFRMIASQDLEGKATLMPQKALGFPPAPIVGRLASTESELNERGQRYSAKRK